MIEMMEVGQALWMEAAVAVFMASVSKKTLVFAVTVPGSLPKGRPHPVHATCLD